MATLILNYENNTVSVQHGNQSPQRIGHTSNIDKTFGQESTGLYPVGVRYHDGRVTVIEQPPARRVLLVRSHNDSRHNGVIKEYHIACPWLVYVSVPAGLSVYARTAALSSLDDDLSVCHLPNVHDDGSICGGVSSMLRSPVGAGIQIAQFMSTVFSDGFYTAYTKYLPQEVLRHLVLGETWQPVHDYGAWLETVEPSTMLEWSWPVVTTLRQAIAEFGAKTTDQPSLYWLVLAARGA